MRSEDVLRGLADELAGIVGVDHLVLGERRDPYSHDATFLTRMPAMAVRPANTEEVAAVVRVCARAEVPIVARGAGTGLSGGAFPPEDGLVLSLERLTDCVIYPDDLCAVAQAGVVTGALQAEAREHGLMYPPDPGSVDMSTIGGNVACNAGGMRCLKYGVTADYVLGLTVVLADGRILTLGGRTRKRSAGYRLMQLFVGSEGTLGIITEVTVKLIGAPRFAATALIGFESIEDAAQAVGRALRAGRHPACLEILAEPLLTVMADALPPGFPPTGAAIIIEHDGSQADSVEEELYGTVAAMEGKYESIAQTERQRERLWEARRGLGAALERSGLRFFGEDIAVPLSAIPELIRRIEAIGDEHGFTIATGGHAGDGNLHPLILFDDATKRLVSPAAAAIFREAVALGGTVSAEHGLGRLKRDFAALEISPDAVELMTAIKRTLDPAGLLNPGKVIPLAAPEDDFLVTMPGWDSAAGVVA